MIKTVKYTNKIFGELSIGDKFEVDGLEDLNYNYHKTCKCIKVDDGNGEEIDGIRFVMLKNDLVRIENG